MNNLKKVLALGLALVMLLGMFTIASAATTTNEMVASDLTDWDSVQHKDAVALMVDLGIINGKDDGSFDPTGNIDRASWAKMVYFAATGDDNADAYVGSATGLNDIQGNWAEGYISFLKASNYISGDNYGNYNPSNNVTVAEANKMMLTVLGYDAEHRGYQNNTAWSGNIMNDAKRNGLMDNVDSSMTALVPLTRENAAEIVYNALQANTVESSVQWDGGVEHVTNYAKISTLGYDVFGVIRIEARVSSVDKDGYAVFEKPTFPEGINIAASNLSNKVKASADVIGETVSLFVEITNAKYDEKTGEMSNPGAVTFRKVISTSVARSATAADVTFTGGFNPAKVTISSDEYYVAQHFATDVKYYLNGMEETLGTTEDAIKQAFVSKIGSKVWDSNNLEPIPGVVVEFYLNEDGEISVVKAYEYSVAQLTGDMETRTSSGELQVRIPGVIATWTAADKVTGYQGLVEDDVVLYYTTTPTAGSTRDAVYVIEKAEKVTGQVTAANSSGQITVNGTRYKRSGLATANTLNLSTFVNFPSTYRDVDLDLYLDKSGAVCFLEQVGDTVNKEKVALVMAAEWTGTDMSTTAGKLEAKLLFIDGTSEIVSVSKLNGLRVVTTKSSSTSTAAKEIYGGPKEASKITDSEKVNGEDTAIHLLHDTRVGQAGIAFYTYRVVDGKYELTVVEKDTTGAVDGWTEPEALTDVSVLKQSNFTDGDSSYRANNDTTFLVSKGEEGEEEYYTYTGFRNVPEMAEADGLVVGTADKPNTAKFVFLTTVSYSDDVPDGYVFIYNNKWEEDPNNEDCYLVNVVNEEGEVTTMSVTEGLKDEISGSKTSSVANWTQNDQNEMVGHFFEVKRIDEKGVVSELESVADLSSMENLVSMGGGVVIGDAGDADCDYDNITKFVFIDLVVVEGDNDASTSDDTLEFYNAGTFNPENFFDSKNVEDTPKVGDQLISEAQKTYDSVQVVTIKADNSTTADYVYVLRVQW